MTYFEMVREFHRAFGCPIKPEPGFPERARRALRNTLLDEEHVELMSANIKADIVAFADALADMVYIICGTALEHGIDLDAVFKEVHRANMAKLGPNGKPIKRIDGKILKPEGWQAPDIAGVLYPENESKPEPKRFQESHFAYNWCDNCGKHLSDHIDWNNKCPA